MIDDELAQAILRRHREVRDRMLAARPNDQTLSISGETLWHDATAEVLTQVLVVLYGAMCAGDKSLSLRQIVEIALEKARGEVMEEWIVLEKFERPDRGDHQLVLKCERGGRIREAVVSGVTYLAAEIGKPVKLTPDTHAPR
jgi:hypothetical protein